ICVDKRYRKRGLGRNLLLFSLKEAVMSVASIERIVLDVTLSNPARRLYQSLGFEDVREFTIFTWTSD
ncbi:MAG: GNAT family N-acetyltransferase, partial [Candidatus Hodarchaeota archaeon]